MKRNTSADSLRGLAIILVVLGHSIVSVAWVYHAGPGLTLMLAGLWVDSAIAHGLPLNIIYGFHMPLFAFVSGLVSWRPTLSPAWKQFRARFLGLMVPYFAWVIVYNVFLSWPPSAMSLWTNLTNAANNPWGGLWYLYALFNCYLLLILIQRLPYARTILAITAIVAAGMAAYPLARTHFLAFNDTLYVYPFFVGGYVLASWPNLLKRRRWVIAGVGTAVFAVLLAARFPLWGPPNPWVVSKSLALSRLFLRRLHWTNTWDNFLCLIPFAVKYLDAFAAIIALTALYSGWRGRLMDWQAWLGRRTLGVYAIHQILQIGLFAIGVTNWAAMFALSLGISIGLTLVLERIPVARGLLLGQWKRPAATRGPNGPEDEFAAEGDVPPQPSEPDAPPSTTTLQPASAS